MRDGQREIRLFVIVFTLLSIRLGLFNNTFGKIKDFIKKKPNFLQIVGTDNT